MAKEKSKVTLDDMIKQLSDEEKEKRYEEATNMVSMLKLIGIECAVCQVSEKEESNIPVLRYAIVIPETNFSKLKDVVKKNI